MGGEDGRGSTMVDYKVLTSETGRISAQPLPQNQQKEIKGSTIIR